MLKRIVTGLLSTVLLVTGTAILTASPAQADERPCVSWTEYQNIRWQFPPATQGRVNDHFDTRGYVLERWGPYHRRDVIRAYPKCREWARGYAVVWFDNYSWDWRSRVYAVAPSLRAYRAGNWHVIQ